MLTNRHKENEILNNRFPLFMTLCICAVIYLGWHINYWYFLLFSLAPLTIKKDKPNIGQVVICFAIITLLLIMFMFIPNFSLFKLIGGLNNPIKNGIFKFWDKHYSQEISSFFKLVLFNVKSSQTYIFYKQTVDLGIVWLIALSGFHVSLITRLIKLMFKKIPRIGWYVNMTLVIFYAYLLGFSYGCMRVFVKICLEPFFYKFRICRYEKLGWIGLIIALVNPSCFGSISFFLTFLVSISAYYVNSLELNNKIINSLLINVFAVVITIPFVIRMNHKISLFTFINTFIFTYLFSFVFLYCLTFCWLPFMAVVHKWIIIACYAIIGNISYSNIFIKSKTWPVWAVYIYYLIYAAIAKLIYFIVYNNKI